MTFPSELLTILSGVTIVLLGAAIMALFRMQPLLERMDERLIAMQKDLAHHENQDELRFTELRNRINRLENAVIGQGYKGD